jgi:hypothetical protein
VLAENLIREEFWHNEALIKDRIAQRIKPCDGSSEPQVCIRPEHKYIDWANGLEEDAVKIGTEFMPEETVYLIDDLAEGSIDPEALLEPHFAVIFEEELGGWHRVEADWPQRRVFETF